MEQENALKTELEAKLGTMISGVKVVRARRVWANTTASNMRDIIAWLRAAGFTHLSTITGVDCGAGFEFLYHLSKGGLMLTLKVAVPAGELALPTITDIFPGAEDYERELVDMFGAKVSGLRPGNRYPLPDGWPENQYPLRKSWKPEHLYPQEENKCQK